MLNEKKWNGIYTYIYILDWSCEKNFVWDSEEGFLFCSPFYLLVMWMESIFHCVEARSLGVPLCLEFSYCTLFSELIYSPFVVIL